MASRYDNAKVIPNARKVDSDGVEHTVRRLETTIYPKFDELFADDTYLISQDGDRLDLLAKEFYGDETFWHLIASVNNLGKGTLAIPPGVVIRIPYYDDYAPISAMIEERNNRR